MSDFAETFLGIRVAPTPTDRRRNRGITLELANLLHYAPKGLFWSSLHDNTKLNTLRKAVSTWDVEEGASTLRSRQVLHQYAYETFEPDNKNLIEAVDWTPMHSSGSPIRH